MGHLLVTETIMTQLQTYSNVDFADLIESTDPELLADDLIFILLSLWAAISVHERRRLLKLILDSASAKDFIDITEDLEDDDPGSD